jgi:acetyl-CoA acetyltransferase family protein
MREAVVVSTARTGIGRAYKGAFNQTKSPSLLGHVISHAVQRARVDGAEVEDAVVGTVLAAGTAGMNVARNGVLAGGLPQIVAAQTIDRQCASGLMAIATAAKQVVVDGMEIVVAAGQENISAVQKAYFDWVTAEQDPRVIAAAPGAYMPMLKTAEIVAAKYDIGREAQDRYALESQRRTAVAQEQGRFREEIVPFESVMAVVDKTTGEVTHRKVTLDRDEGNRPDTTLESLLELKAVLEGGTVTAGNASQLSDGASACVIMEARTAQRRGLQALGIYRGMAVAGCAPEEMGIGPVFAIPKLLKLHGLKIDDIGLWELNEAFACQAIYCRDKLGIDPDKYNVNGGGISVGHPYGMTGARIAAHAMIEGKRRNVRYVVATMCAGGGMGAAALFEVG